MTMAEKVTFVSVNLRGAQLAEKRKDVLNFLKQKLCRICALTSCGVMAPTKLRGQ